jgi:transcriptional regulator with XRE-family HTH domain
MNPVLVKNIESPVHGGDMDAAGGCEGLGRVSGGKLDSHDFHGRTFCNHVKTGNNSFSDLAKNATAGHDEPVSAPKKSPENDRWPQRRRFFELVDAKVASGVTLEEIAEAMGLETTNSLEVSYRKDRSRRPARTKIERAAEYFGVNISEIDGPRIVIESEKDEVTLAREFLEDAMGHEIASRLTDDQAVVARKAAIAKASQVVAALLDD